MRILFSGFYVLHVAINVVVDNFHTSTCHVIIIYWVFGEEGRQQSFQLYILITIWYYYGTSCIFSNPLGTSIYDHIILSVLFFWDNSSFNNGSLLAAVRASAKTGHPETFVIRMVLVHVHSHSLSEIQCAAEDVRYSGGGTVGGPYISVVYSCCRS